MAIEIRDLSTTATAIRACPVFVVYDADADDIRPCGAFLEVIEIRTVRGDDYGSWPVAGYGFACGHTFAQMTESARHADEI